MQDVVIVGGGAAGLWAAIAAAERGREVLLLEKTPRFGTKILASGGTRCNLTTALAADAAAAAFGHGGSRFLRTAFRILPPERVRARFAGWGVPSVVEPALEKVFPESGRALDVRDALVREATRLGVALRARSPVEALRPLGEAESPAGPAEAEGKAGARGWELRVGGETLRTRELVLAAGGKSYPKTGTVGEGYAWLEALGLPLVEPAPALTPLVSPASWVHELAGVTLEDVALRLIEPSGRVIAARRRPLLFTHRGVSGPGAMDLSEPVARAEQAGATPHQRLAIDLCPEESEEQLRARYKAAAERAPRRSVRALLPESVPRRALAALLAGLGLEEPLPRVGELPRRERQRLVTALKGWQVPLSGTRGFDHAEVTAGGLALSALDPGSMRVRAYERLFVLGELVDLQGPIGGFNFQAAFACGELVGRALGAAR